MGLPQQIFVTNTNDFTHTDYFDGEEFVFPPKERVLIPVDAAVHMLGFNMADKSDALSRLGWGMRIDPQTHAITDNPEGLKKLSKFQFERVSMVPDKNPLKAETA